MGWAEDLQEIVWEKGDVRAVLRPTEYQDDFDNPRNEDYNVGVMACEHQRYNLGDYKNDTANEVLHTLREHGRVPREVVERWLRIFYGATEVVWLGLIDHSGLSMYAGGGPSPFDPGGWDSGTVGLIFDTPKTRETTGIDTALVAEALRTEIKVYDAYLQGQVYVAVLQRRVVITTSGVGIDRSESDWDDDEYVGVGVCVDEDDGKSAVRDVFPEDSDYSK